MRKAYEGLRWLMPTLGGAVVSLMFVGLVAGCAASDGEATAPARSAIAATPSPARGDTSTPAVVADDSADTAGPQPGSPANAAVAQEFVRFAAADEASPSWASSVTLFVDGKRQESLNMRSASTRANWEVCPSASASLEGRECPLSPLATLQQATAEGRPVLEAKVPDHVGCTTVRQPAALPHSDQVSIRPGVDRRDCFSDFVVTLYLDASKRISGVNFVLSSP